MQTLKSRIAYAHILAVLSFPAAAQDVSQGPYVGFGAGMSFLSDSDFSSDAASALGVDAEVDFDTGYALSGALGYRFANGFRVEGEVGYRHHDVDGETVTGPGGSITGNIDDDVTSLSFMANAYRDFQTESGVIPYLGIGLGFSRVELGGGNETINGATAHIPSDSDTVFAYAAMAGVSVPVAESTSLSVEYKYLGADEPHLNGGDYEYDSHTFGAKLSYSF